MSGDPQFDEDFDAVCIGGGPGGSTTAALLARRGRRALVLEKDHLPRFHIGESLLPSSTPVLRDLGLFEELDRLFVRKHGARFLDDNLQVDASGSTARYDFAGAFPPSIPHAWQVTRAEFDNLLLRNAQKLGAEVREGWKVKGAIRDGERVIGVEAVSPEGVTRKIGARVVVDATGREAMIARTQKDKTRIPGLDKTAVFTQIRGGHRKTGEEIGDIEIVILAGKNPDGTTPGWAWFIPFKDGRTSIGFVLSTSRFDEWMKGGEDLFERQAQGLPTEYNDRSADSRQRLERLFDACIERSPWMKHLVSAAPKLEPVRAAADFSFRVGKLAGDGWLAVGDSAGFLDPLFSTGAHLAMGGGQRAAKVIDEALTANDFSAERFAEYAKSLRKAADLFLGAVQSFYRGELRELLFHPEQRPALRKTITSMLAGDVFHDQDLPQLWVSYFREHFPPQL